MRWRLPALSGWSPSQREEALAALWFIAAGVAHMAGCPPFIVSLITAKGLFDFVESVVCVFREWGNSSREPIINSYMTEADLDFCRQHLKSWCERNGMEDKMGEIWSRFMLRPNFYFSNNYGWTEIAGLAGVQMRDRT